MYFADRNDIIEQLSRVDHMFYIESGNLLNI